MTDADGEPVADRRRPASERFELVVEHAAGDRGAGRWFDRLRALVARVRGLGPDEAPGVRIFSLRDRADGAEVLRHIEDWHGPDEAPDLPHEEHLYERIERDLASMTVDEFVARWVR